MDKNTIGLNMTILTEDFRSAINEASSLANEFNLTILLNYRNFYQFTITPKMTLEEINKLKSTKICIPA